MKLFTSIVVIATLIVAFSACERAQQIIQPITPEMETMDTTVSIGVALPLTGALAPTGELMKQGFELALDEINHAQPSDMQLDFIFTDDTGGPEGAVAAFNHLIDEEGLSLIIGPATSASTEAAFPIAQENQVVAISPTSSQRGLSAIGDYVFRVALTGSIVITQGVEVTHAKLGYQTAATLYDAADSFSTDRDETLQEALAAKNVEVLTTETYQTGDTDFSAQLTRIQALNPDIIFVSALPPEKPLMLVQANELGISAPIVMSSLTDLEIEAARAAAEGTMTFDVPWLPTDTTPGNQAFVQNYTDRFGIVPNSFSTLAYASAHILAVAIGTAHSTEPMAVRDALANISELDTVLGKFSFDADGDAIYAPKVMIVHNGMLQPLE